MIAQGENEIRCSEKGEKERRFIFYFTIIKLGQFHTLRFSHLLLTNAYVCTYVFTYEYVRMNVVLFLLFCSRCLVDSSHSVFKSNFGKINKI